MFLFFYTNPVLIAAAVIPAIALLVMVYRMDRLDKEPTWLLVRLVIMGVVAAGLSMLTERTGTWVLNHTFRTANTLYFVLTYYVVVACSEEGFKYLLMKGQTWNNPAFNCQFDAVVYSVFVSLGFALWENIGYVAMYGFQTALIRAVTAIPGHACFGVFMGAMYGVAKKYDNWGYEKRSHTFRILSFLVPVFMHGTYDYIATIESVSQDGSAWWFVGFIAVLFGLAFLLIRRLSAKDHYI